MAHRIVVVNTAHLALVLAAVEVLGVNVKSLRRINLLRTVTMTTVRQEKTRVHGVDPLQDAADLLRDAADLPRDAVDLPRDVVDLLRDVCRQVDMDLHRGEGHRHAAMNLAAGVVPVVVHHATTIEIVGMIAVMIGIVVVLETVAVVVVVDLVTVVAVMIVAEVVASETVVGIAEEVDLTIDAEREAMIVVAVEEETAGIAVEEVADMEGVMIDVMNVVPVVEVI